jgi:hypothetical protein
VRSTAEPAATAMTNPRRDGDGGRAVRHEAAPRASRTSCRAGSRAGEGGRSTGRRSPRDGRRCAASAALSPADASPVVVTCPTIVAHYGARPGPKGSGTGPRSPPPPGSIRVHHLGDQRDRTPGPRSTPDGPHPVASTPPAARAPGRGGHVRSVRGVSAARRRCRRAARRAVWNGVFSSLTHALTSSSMRSRVSTMTAPCRRRTALDRDQRPGVSGRLDRTSSFLPTTRRGAVIVITCPSASSLGAEARMQLGCAGAATRSAAAKERGSPAGSGRTTWAGRCR